MNGNATQARSESAEDRTNAPDAGSNGKPISLADTDEAVRAFVAERPFAAVGIALVAGYLLGRAINAAR